LAGLELTPENLKNCIAVDNREGILVYKFKLRKPFICAEIHSDKISDMIEKEDKSKGLYVFNNIVAYMDFLNGKQCPFKFLIISEDDVKELNEPKNKANRVIIKKLGEKSTIITVEDLWKAYMTEKKLNTTVLKSNFKSNGINFDEINSKDHPYKVNMKNNHNKIALFERHYHKDKEGLTPENICFYEPILKF